MTGFHAIILAAGRSTRMGREKCSLPWLDGKPLLMWMAGELAAAGWQPVAVVRPERLAYWSSLLPAGCTVANPDPDRGKTTSVAAGLRHVTPEAGWLMVTSVDQPCPPALYRRLRREAEMHPAKIIVPGREGGRGHPVVLDASLREELLALDEASQGLRGLLDAHRAETYRLPDDDPAQWQWDLNTPAAYEEALAFFRENFPSTLHCPKP
jgi:molybdenum cofactor cytidylyltransferase